jgi:biotin operon repressor
VNKPVNKPKSVRTRALSILRDEKYSSASVLSEKLGISESRVYQLVGAMRRDGIGVHPTPKGYILSEFATKIDDVHFLRRINGRRASDYIALYAAEADIRKRWFSTEDQRLLKIVLDPLHVNLNTVIANQRTMLDVKLLLEDKSPKKRDKIEVKV